jgi:hypothetical protein
MSTQPSTPESWDEDPKWPVAAIPQRWIERLFGTMEATYGARFADLWRGTDAAVVKRQWGLELAKLTSAQLKAGRENLMALVRVPTLPEFIAHCRQSRAEAVEQAAAPKLEFLPKMSPEQAAANLAKVHAGIRSLRMDQASAEWAFRLVMRGKTPGGHALTHEALRCARDAITSAAGKRVVEECAEPAMREQYAKLRQATIDDYRMRGIRLWNVA